MPAFHRQPRPISSAARAASGFSTKRATACASPMRRAALDVAVGGGRPGRLHAEDDDAAVGRQPRRPLRRRGEGGGVRDQMVRRQHQQRRARVAPLGDAGRHRDRRQRVARHGLEHRLDPRAGLARLVGDEEVRRRRADDDRVGERPAGEPRDRALERRGAAHDRRMLLGEVAPRHRPQPRPRPAAEDRRHDVAGPPAGDADGDSSVMVASLRLAACPQEAGTSHDGSRRCRTSPPARGRRVPPRVASVHGGS